MAERAPALLEDPPAEILAMVWGPRFDREHAMAFADRYDALPREAQQAVRERLVAQLGSLVADNAACRASC